MPGTSRKDSKKNVGPAVGGAGPSAGLVGGVPVDGTPGVPPVDGPAGSLDNPVVLSDDDMEED